MVRRFVHRTNVFVFQYRFYEIISPSIRSITASNKLRRPHWAMPMSQIKNVVLIMFRFRLTNFTHMNPPICPTCYTRILYWSPGCCRRFDKWILHKIQAGQNQQQPQRSAPKNCANLPTKQYFVKGNSLWSLFLSWVQKLCREFGLLMSLVWSEAAAHT